MPQSTGRAMKYRSASSLSHSVQRLIGTRTHTAKPVHSAVECFLFCSFVVVAAVKLRMADPKHRKSKADNDETPSDAGGYADVCRHARCTLEVWACCTVCHLQLCHQHFGESPCHMHGAQHAAFAQPASAGKPPVALRQAQRQPQDLDWSNSFSARCEA